jgi:AbrB family looped-hinge helix DNA binding protein
MKNSGIVRRLDDLGRIVIPKEIRKTLNLKEGDAMVIEVDSDKRQVILTEYNLKPNFEEMWNELKNNKTIAREVFEAIENTHKNK